MPLSVRVSLPRPPVKKWVPKIAPPFSDTPPDVASTGVAPPSAAPVCPAQPEISLSVLALACPAQSKKFTSAVALSVVAPAIPAQPVSAKLSDSIFWNAEERDLDS